MAVSHIDAALLEPREVKRFIEDEDGGGYLCDLECGHTVWTALEPGIAMHCGLCLARLIAQAREIQAAQRIH